MKKKSLIILIIIFASIILYLLYTNGKDTSKVEEIIPEENSYKSNIMQDVGYSSKDTKGNEYTVNASQGEIDFNNSNVIYLTNVEALIKLNNSRIVKITSDYGNTILLILIQFFLKM